MAVSVKNIAILKSGLFPILTVTAPAGSTIDLLVSSVVVQTYTLAASETSHSFEVSVNTTYTVRATNGSQTNSKTVLIDEVAEFTISFLDYQQYVTNGLICHLDGIANGGFNNHLTSLSQWTDLSGNSNHGTIMNTVTVNDDSIRTTDSGWIRLPGSLISTSYYYELVFECPTDTSVTNIFMWCGALSQDTPSFWTQASNHRGCIRTTGKGDYYYYDISSFSGNILALSTAGDAPASCYLNGTSVNGTYDTAGNLVTGGDNYLMLGYRGATSVHYDYKYYSLRVYNRYLSSQEIASNYLVDAERFNIT